MGFIPVKKGISSKATDPVAVLLRVEERLIHGQIVQVSVYGPGSSGRVAYKPGAEIAASFRVGYQEERKDYHPETELAYIGLPSSPAADMRGNNGELPKKKIK